MEIHPFADASSQPYRAAFYLREVIRFSVHVSLQAAKSRVAPTQTLSIPWLKLCTSHLTARLINQYVQLISKGNCKIHLWSDSLDVSYWFRSHWTIWKTFLANRCAETHELTPTAYWHHLEPVDNPADIVSRGLPPELLKSTELWWQLPHFLRKNLEAWPTYSDSLELNSCIKDGLLWLCGGGAVVEALF